MSTNVAASEREFGLKSSDKLTQKASLNLIASLLDYFAKIAVSLLLTPILVAGLGRSLFGVWEMLSRLVGYMSVTDGRPTEALRLIVANQQAIDNPASKRRYMGSALAVWVLFLPILAAAGTILVWLSPTITKVSPESHATVRLTAALLVINFVLANFAALPESVLRGMNLGYKRMGLQAGLNLVGGVITAEAIYIGSGLAGIAMAQLVLTCVAGILFWYVVKKYVAWFGFARPTKSDLKQVLGLSIWNTAGNLIAKVHLASDVIILGVITSASTVTTYVLTGYAAQAVTGIVTLNFVAVTPGFGGLIGWKKYEKTAALRKEMMAMNWLLVTTIGSTILLWNRSFLHLWVGENYYAGSLANLLIVLVMAQTTFIRSDASLIDATLKLRKRVLVASLAALFSIVLSILLIPSLGIIGLCLGLLLGRLVQTASYPFLVNSCLGKSQQFRLSWVVRPGLVTVLCFACSSYLGMQLMARNWLEGSLFVAASIALILGISFAIGLSADSRESIIRRFRQIRLSVR